MLRPSIYVTLGLSLVLLFTSSDAKHHLSHSIRNEIDRNEGVQVQTKSKGVDESISFDGGIDDNEIPSDGKIEEEIHYQYQVRTKCDDVYVNMTVRQACTIKLVRSGRFMQMKPRLKYLTRHVRSSNSFITMNQTRWTAILNLMGCSITYGSEEHRYNESILWDMLYNSLTIGQVKCIDPQGRQRIWTTHGIPLLNFNSLLKQTSYPIYATLWTVIALFCLLILSFTVVTIIKCCKCVCCCCILRKSCCGRCGRKCRSRTKVVDEARTALLDDIGCDRFVNEEETIMLNSLPIPSNTRSEMAQAMLNFRTAMRKPAFIRGPKSTLAYMPITIAMIACFAMITPAEGYRLTMGLNPGRDILYAKVNGEVHSFYMKSRTDHYEVRRHIRIHDCEFAGGYNLLCKMSDLLQCNARAQPLGWRCYVTPRGVPVAMTHQHQSFPYFDSLINYYNTHYALDIPVDESGNSLYCNTIPNNIRREYNYTMEKLDDYADVYVVSYDYTEVALSYRGCDVVINSKSGIVYDSKFEDLCRPLFEISLVPGMAPILKSIDKLLDINITKAPSFSGLYVNTGLDIVPNGEHAFCYTDGHEYRWNHNAQERMLDIGRVIRPPPVMELIKSASTRPLLNSAGGECKAAELQAGRNELLLKDCQGGLMALDVAIDEQQLVKVGRAAVSNVEMLPFEGCNEDWTGIRVKLRVSVTKAGIVDISCDSDSCPTQKIVLPVGSWEVWIGVKHAGEIIMYVNDFRRMLTITCASSTGTANLAIIRVVNNIGSYAVPPPSTWTSMMLHTKWWIWLLIALAGLFFLCIIIPVCLGLGNFIRNMTKS